MKMERDKIMAGGNLENTVNRLSCCCAMLDIVHANMNGDSQCIDALCGCRDLLELICRDFEADIASAEDFVPATEVVA